MEIKIAKHELYPTNNPTGIAIGYSVKTKNGKTFYKDVIVPLAQTVDKTELEVVDLAWSIIGGAVLAQVNTMELAKNLIGSVWYPPGYAPEPPPVTKEDPPKDEKDPKLEDPIITG